MGNNRPDTPLASTPDPQPIGSDRADSLMNSSNQKKNAAANQILIGKAQIKNKVKDGGYFGGNRLPVGQERIDIANKMLQSAKQDSIQSVRLRNK